AGSVLGSEAQLQNKSTRGGGAGRRGGAGAGGGNRGGGRAGAGGRNGCTEFPPSTVNICEPGLSPPMHSTAPPTTMETCPIPHPLSFQRHLPSHCSSLFSALRDLRDAELLLDCTLLLSGAPCRVHAVVLAAVSSSVQAWLSQGGGDKGSGGVWPVECGQVTSAGVQAVLHYAYSGEIAPPRDGAMSQILEVCRWLGAERLALLFTGVEETPGAANERERSLGIIKDLWERGVGCDFQLQAETGESFPAHRAVLAAGGDYFRALLCSGMREVGEGVVRLQGVRGWVLQALLRFMYTGTLWVEQDSVWELAEAAAQFQLQGALALCQDALLEHMDEQMWLGVLQFGQAHGLTLLSQGAERYALSHFHTLLAGDTLPHLPKLSLERLLQDDSLSANSEVQVQVEALSLAVMQVEVLSLAVMQVEALSLAVMQVEVFRAVVKWVEMEPQVRCRLLPQLLQLIRFPLLSEMELQEVEGCGLMTSQLWVIIQTLRRTSCRPRTPKQVLVVLGGDCVDEDFSRRCPDHRVWAAQSFVRGLGLIRTIEWKQLPSLPDTARFRHSVCVLKNHLYVLGGRKYYGARDILQSAVRFDVVLQEWECIADMKFARDYFAVVCHEGKLFVLGGNHDDHTFLDSVEIYTPEDNTWRLSHPLAMRVCGHAAAVLGGHIFVSGGCNAHLHCLPSLWRYEPGRGCSDHAPMVGGAGRAGHVMLAVGGRLFVAGGVQPMGAGYRDQLQCEAYDLTLDTWMPLPCLPRPHLSPAATLLDGDLYLLGGSSADSAQDTPWVHRYDSRAQRWDRLGALPRPYADLTACTLLLPQNY
ncbi:hypothetical protein JZ751_003667, partial [Albula glossodonta]